MPSLGRVGRQLTSLFWRASVEEEVDAELAFHIDMLTCELVERGLSRDAAHAEAVRRFGDVRSVSDTCRTIGRGRERDARRAECITEVRQDARYAVRQLAKSPGFTAVAALTLALGIGATTAIFSAVDSVVLRPFAFAHPDRVVRVVERWRNQDDWVSVGNYVDWQRESRSFSQLAAVGYTDVNLADGGIPERVSAARVTDGYFAVFGVPAALGRVFTAAEDRPGADGVVVLSDGLWKRRFGGDPHIIGRTIRLSAHPYTIVGVMPPGFDPLTSGEQLWLPSPFWPAQLADHDDHYLTVVGLLAPGVTREQAQTDMSVVMRRIDAQYPKADLGRGVRVAPFAELIVGNLRQRLFVLLGAVSLVLLIACGNVANLLLARGASRAKEIAIRVAMGAGRGRIVRQLLTESLVLALLATLLGVGLAWIGIPVLVAGAPAEIPRINETRINGAVLAFAVLLAVLSSIVFGLVPAWRAARQNVQGVLRDGGRGMGGARDTVRSALIAGEVALALTLLVGAGLLIRSARHLQHVDPGFDPSGVLTARLALPRAAYPDAEQVTRTFHRIVDALREERGVERAAAVSRAPMGAGFMSNGLTPEGWPQDIAHVIQSQLHLVTPGYLRTMHIPLLRGRAFTEHDRADAPRVMIVSAALARKAWPNEDPIGKRIACCDSASTYRWKTVVGVVADVHTNGLPAEPGPEFYLPIDQAPQQAWEWTERSITLVARGSGNPAALAGAMRDAVRQVDPTVPLYDVTTMGQAIHASTAQERFNTILLTTLGVMGLVLAAVGIYGVIGYFVSVRTPEIGIRMALGATGRDIALLMTWQAARPVFLGIALGAVASFALTRLLRGSLYGVSPTDPATFLGVAIVLVAVGLAASLIPARRATRVSPTRALQAG